MFISAVSDVGKKLEKKGTGREKNDSFLKQTKKRRKKEEDEEGAEKKKINFNPHAPGL